MADDAGMTALHHACWHGHDAGVAWLLRQPDLLTSARDASGRTCLHASVLNGHDDAARLLMQETPELVFLRDRDARTALHIACENGDLPSVKTLLTLTDAGKVTELVEMVDEKGTVVLHDAAYMGRTGKTTTHAKRRLCPLI